MACHIYRIRIAGPPDFVKPLEMTISVEGEGTTTKMYVGFAVPRKVCAVHIGFVLRFSV